MRVAVGWKVYLSCCLAGATLLFAGSCAELAESSRTAYQEFSEICAEGRETFAAALRPDIPSDLAIQARYGESCDLLQRQEGVEFGPERRVYTCRALLPRTNDEPAQRKMDSLEQAFGKRWDASSFHPAASEPDDLRPNAYREAERMVGTPAFDRQIPIGNFSVLAGISVVFIILSDKDGNVERVVATRDELAGALHNVTSLQGAFALLEWHERLGFEKRAQCTARTVYSDTTGWTFEGVTIAPNCRPKRLRDLFVARTGTSKILSERAPFYLFGSESMTCSD